MSNPLSNFCNLTEKSSVVTNIGASEISTPLELAVGTHFLPQDGTKTIPVFLTADGKAF